MTRLQLKDVRERRYRMARRPEVSIQPCAPRPQRRDCHGRLVSALVAMAGERCEVEAASQRPWCSATFVGTQHRVALRLTGCDASERAQALAASLPEAEVNLANHIVVDLAIDAVQVASDNDAVLILAVLTIEDW
jgi:hypothetical protein